MTELVLFAAYCRRMAAADHTDACPSQAPPSRPRWNLDDPATTRLDGFTPTPPRCDGCIRSEDRELWAQLADEIEGHLEADHDEAGLF